MGERPYASPGGRAADRRRAVRCDSELAKGRRSDASFGAAPDAADRRIGRLLPRCGVRARESCLRATVREAHASVGILKECRLANKPAVRSPGLGTRRAG